MSFRLELGDITEIKADAIVNSVGPNGSVHGRLCKAILNAAESYDMKVAVDSVIDGVPGTTFVTKGGKLPAKHVIHVVTPYKSHDDENNSKLLDCYRKVINLAIKNGYKSIGLPLIGSIASGYSDKESYNTLIEACREIDDREEKEDKEIIEMIAVSYLKKTANYENRPNDLYEDELMYKLTYKISNIPHTKEESKELEHKLYNECIHDLYSCCKLMSKVNFEDTVHFSMREYSSMFDAKHPYNFLLYIFSEREITEKEALSPYCDNEQRKGLRRTDSLKNYILIQLAVIAGLTTTEFLEWMIVCGNSLSPLSRIDREIIRLLREKDLDDYIYEDIKKSFKENVGINLSFNKLSPTDIELDKAWLKNYEIEELKKKNNEL